MTEAQQLRVEFLSTSSDVYTVVARSPRGEVKGEFRLPFEPESAGKLVRETKAQLADGASLRDETHIGKMLFDALFQDELRSLFDRTQDYAQHAEWEGFRLRLVMDLDDEKTARLASLPWELLAKDQRFPLSTDSRCWIVRHVNVDQPNVVKKIAPPLRVLVAVANPKGTFEIDRSLIEQEISLFRDSFADHREVEVTIIDHASIAAIRDAFHQQEYHAFHYLGHGAFKRGSATGVLYLEDDAGNHSMRQVDGLELGTLLKNHGSIRLVVLNACKSAETTFKQEYDPFQGVATALVKSGLPAVIAMQFIISVEAAVQFSKGFYPELVQSGKVDKATAAGRAEIYHGHASDIEWATPVLFMRTDDGQLFDMDEPMGARGEAAGGDASVASSGGGGSRWGPGQEEELGVLFWTALGSREKPGVETAYNALKTSVEKLDGTSYIISSLNKLEGNPARNGTRRTLVADLIKIQPLADSCVSDAAQELSEAMSEALSEADVSQASVQLNVTGTGHTFSGTGDINIGGDYVAGGRAKKKDEE